MNNSSRLNGKPFVIEAQAAHASGVVRFLPDGQAIVTYFEKEFIVPVRQQYDLTQATIFGLNERLTLAATSPVIDETGATLRDQFNSEWEAYATELARSAEGGALTYGFYAYYVEENDLVRYCPPYWHHLVAVASSSKLLADPEGKLSWKQIWDILANTTIAVAGCSVGSSIIQSVSMDMRPRAIKIADKSVYKMENINRVKVTYKEIVRNQAERAHPMELPLKNKAESVARQLYAIDPFMDVFVYANGVQPETIDSFLGAGDGEPKTDFVVEEVDDPRIKILIREEARKRKLPVLMVTDIGSAVQLDILRYDLDSSLSLTWGMSDSDLYKKMEAVYADPGNKKLFFEFVDALIGRDYRRDELAKIIDGKSEIPTATIIPQLGSTVAMAGAIAAEAIARIRLGWTYPARVVLNKHTFEVTLYR